ncbi:MAG: response regulator, partial [Fibrobacter sp.]|nr:response regulator [Fibrobacter sp.]
MEEFYATKGVISLKEWNPDHNLVMLEGDWNFYWDKLLDQHQIANETASPIKIGKEWYKQKPDKGPSYPRFGSATFHLKVRDIIQGRYGIRLKNLRNFALYINGELRHESAGYGSDSVIIEPLRLNDVFYFSARDSFDILIKIKSYYNGKNSGLLYTPVLGSEEGILSYKLLRIGITSFILGIVLIIGLYNLLLFITDRKSLAALLFSLFCFCAFIRGGLVNEPLLMELLPDSGDLFYKLIAATTILLLPLAVSYFYTLYPDRVSRFVVYTIIISSFLLCPVSIIIPTSSLLAPFSPFFLYQLLVLVSVILTLYLLTQALIRKKDGAAYNTAGLLAIIFAAVNDILMNFNLIHSIFLVPHALVIYAILQTYLNTRERSQAYRTIGHLNDSLIKLDKIKDEFLANTSHELRTPLHGIIGIAESMNNGKDGPLPQKVKDDLNLIKTIALKQNNLINDILDFSKLRNRELTLHKSAVDIHVAVQIVLTVFERALQNKNFIIVSEVPKNAPMVYADEVRVEQILYNLIGNAIKFTDNGSITISSKQEGNFLAISVTDTGIGIPAEYHSTLFQPFHQIEESDKRVYGGTGLGLSITKNLVELHGGTITFNSEVNRGTTFTFSLPLADDFSQSASSDRNSFLINRMVTDVSDWRKNENNNQENNSDETQNTAVSNVLAVDDDPVNLRVIMNHLSALSVKTTAVESGKEALNLINNGFVPDCVILDIMMPGMSGYEVCKTLRTRFSHHELPVIIVTARNQINDLSIAFECGANDYLVKPFLKEELVTRISVALSINQASKAINENETLKTQLYEKEQLFRETRMNNYKLSKILSIIHDSVCVLGDDDEICFLSEQFSSLLGYSKDTLIGRNFTSLLQKVPQELKEMLYGEKEITSDYIEKVTFKSDTAKETNAHITLMKLETMEETFKVVIIKPSSVQKDPSP